MNAQESIETVLSQMEKARRQVINARAALDITGIVKELNGYVGYHEAMRSLTFAAMSLGMELDEINEQTHERAKELLREQDEDKGEE